jgi:hypothetical protein
MTVQKSFTGSQTSRNKQDVIKPENEEFIRKVADMDEPSYRVYLRPDHVAHHSPTFPIKYITLAKMKHVTQNRYQVRSIVMQQLQGDKIKSSSQILHSFMIVNSSRSDYGS